MSDILHMESEHVQEVSWRLYRLADAVSGARDEICAKAGGMDWTESQKGPFLQDLQAWAGKMSSLSEKIRDEGSGVEKEVEEMERAASHFNEGYTPFIRGDGDPYAVDASDIHQGDYGDCFLMSSMGAIALNHPELLEGMIEDLGDGRYRVRFYDRVCDNFGLGPCHYVAHYVIVDGTFPKELADPTDRVGGTQESWTLIIEKAYRQLQKENGMPIEGGLPLPSIALSAITGRDSQNIPSALMSIQDLYKDFKRGDAITAGSDWFGGLSKYFGPQSPTDPNPMIPREHIFFVTNVDPVNNTVTVQNPWGADHQPQFVTMTFQEYQSCFWLTTTNPVG
jgi:hypothetical protein